MLDQINHKLPPRQAFEFDSQIVEDHPCPECGGECYYDSHYEDSGEYPVYRAFSICKKCGHTEEF